MYRSQCAPPKRTVDNSRPWVVQCRHNITQCNAAQQKTDVLQLYCNRMYDARVPTDRDIYNAHLCVYIYIHVHTAVLPHKCSIMMFNNILQYSTTKHIGTKKRLNINSKNISQNARKQLYERIKCITQLSTLQYSAVQYSTVQYSTVQYSTVQYSTVQYSILLYSMVSIVLW